MTHIDAAEALVDHALGLRWDQIPAATRGRTLALLEDTLCVGVAGMRASHADSVLAMAQDWGEGDTAGVLGRPGARLPATGAAFVNAFQIHGQEYDCVHEPAVLHPMATLLAALIAECERGPCISGARLLTAIVAGVDVSVTLGLAAPGPLSFFRPATAGIFGCVAAIANLRDFPRETALDAFGHALALASGTMQAHAEGKPALPLQVASAARNALVALDLAQAGMSGVRRPIEGPFGYLTLFETRSDTATAIGLLGQGFRIDEVSWKPFPTGRAAHGGIAAVQQFMEVENIDAADVAALEYHAPPLIHRLVGRAAFKGMATGHARLCLPWLAAVTLTGGTVALEDFTPARLDDPVLLALADRVTVVALDNPDPAAFVPAFLLARLHNGRTARIEVSALLGSPLWPLDRSQRDAKAASCLAYAGLGAQLAPLQAALAGLPDASDAVAALRSAGIWG